MMEISLTLLNVVSPILSLPFWPFLISILLTLAVLYTRAVNTNNWVLVVRSTFSSRATQQLIREENSMENTFSGILVLTFFFSFAMLIYNLNQHFKISMTSYNFVVYGVILVSLFVIYLVKVAALFLLQILFKSKELFEEYVIGFFNINIMFGILLIPINLMLIYSIDISKSFLFYFALSAAVLALIFRFIRVFDIAERHNVGWHNIILYLCTLEILPILLMVKTLDYLGLMIDLT